MSVGIGAHARLVLADESMLIYTYACYNLNRSGWECEKTDMNGELYLSRSVLSDYEPCQTHPGRHRRSDRDARMAPVFELMEKGAVQVRCASEEAQIAARILLLRILYQYQNGGIIPETVDCYC